MGQLDPTRLKRTFCDALVALANAERRLDPYFRDGFDRVAQRPLAAAAQTLIGLTRSDAKGLGIAGERAIPGEERITAEIVAAMSTFLHRQYPDGHALRAGNTKTYGVVRGEFRVRDDLPPPYRHGVFEPGCSYPVWVRFGGPGPLAPPDPKDNGILSLGIKLMGVDGEKLMDDERFTQDFTGISAPTFTTPNVVENLKLQRQLVAGTPVWYFVNPLDSHLLDGVMQGLYARLNTSPLEVTYWSCVAYLLGAAQAMHYIVRPQSDARTPIPRPPGANYLREAMATTLALREVRFDFLIQLQTDPWRMPIENASVRWSETDSVPVPVAELVLPAQHFDSSAQLAFAGNLSYNPWHAIAEHRPLGNQNRARRAIYLELSKLRRQMDGEAHIEPTGDERF
jgi:hypothetical protein